MAEVSGFFYPRTATGRSSLLPPPPWHYSGDLLTVEYRTDPARVAELLPGPLQPAPEDPGAVALIWADWQSCGDAGDELLDPVRAQYRECFAVVRCAFAGAALALVDLLDLGTEGGSAPIRRGDRPLASGVVHKCHL